MLLPNEFQLRPFAEWNDLLRGLMVVWEFARSRNLEAALETHLRQDEQALLEIGRASCRERV